MANAPIYVDDPLRGFNDHLLKLMIAKQQREGMEEDIAIRQKHLKLQQEEAAMKQQEAASQQASVMQTFMQAQQDPNVAAMTVPALQALGNANVPNAQAFGEVNAVAAPQQMGRGEVMPSPIQQKQAAIAEEKAAAAMFGRVRPFMTANEFSRLQTAVELKRYGIDDSLVDDLLPESMMQVLQRQELALKNRAAANQEEADANAHEYLTSIGIKLPAASGANKFVQDMIAADKAFARQRALNDRQSAQADARQRSSDDRADSRERMKATIGATDTLRKEFQASGVVQKAQVLVSEASKIRGLWTGKRTGTSDTGMVYSYVRMLDVLTGVKEGERGMIQNTGSAKEAVKAKLGQWKEGTLLTDVQRQWLVEATETILDSHRQTFNDYKKWYVENAQASGVDPERVTMDPFATWQPLDDYVAEQKLKTATGR